MAGWLGPMLLGGEEELLKGDDLERIAVLVDFAMFRAEL
jgi:hypothetical protein